jgi:hypothetical protein
LTRVAFSWKAEQGASRRFGDLEGGPAAARSAGELGLGEEEVRENLPSCRGVGEKVAGSESTNPR